jgi:hypothetical protein
MSDALTMLRNGLEVAGDSAGAAHIPIATSEIEATRVFADRSREQLRDLELGMRKGEWVPPDAFAWVYAELQDPDETLRWLDSMRVGRDPLIHMVALNPLFDFVRNDPRYRAWEATLPWRQARVARADTTTAHR